MSSRFSARAGGARRRVAYGLVAVAAAVMVPVAIAWACNPQANLSLDRSSYGPGDTITVSGSYFRDGDTISVSTAGSETTTTVSGGGFTVAVTAPSQAGSYTVTASRVGGYRAGLPKTASYQVVAPTSANDGSAGSGGRSFGTPQVPKAQQVAGVGGGGGSVSAPGSGESVFAGSVAAPSTGGGTFFSGGGGAAAAAAGAARPSEQSATADIWSGFAPGSAASLTSSGDGAPDGGTGSGLSLGIILLAVGLVAMVGGLATAEVMRRRAPGR